MASVEAWQAGHDKLCAQRYADIEKALTVLTGALGGLKSGQNKAVWLAASILIAVVGWMGAQLYGGMQQDIHRNDRPPASASQQAHDDSGYTRP